MNRKTKAVVFAFLLGVAAGAVAAPPKTPSKPAALVAADKLYEKKRWREAEQAYAQYARSANDAGKYEAQLKTALCMVNGNDLPRAIPTLTRLVNSPSVERDAPDVLARACTHLYGIYLGQKNGTPQRERLVTECVRKLPAHEAAARLCEYEAAVWLKCGNPSKAVSYLKSTGSGISEGGAAMLALLSVGGAVSDGDIAALSRIAKAPSVSWKSTPDAKGKTASSPTVAESDPELLSALCQTVAKRPEGWKAEYFLASYFAESGRATESIATLDAMLKSGHGPSERVEFFRAETLAFRTNRADEAARAYKAWLSAHPSSTLWEKAFYQYAQLLHTCGRDAEAISLVEGQIAARSDSPYAKAGAELLAKSKAVLVAKAKQALEEEKQVASMRVSPANPGALVLERTLRSGEKLITEKKYALAAKELQRFRGSATDPKWGRGWFCFGTCLRETGDTVGALRTWRNARLIVQKPENSRWTRQFVILHLGIPPRQNGSSMI